MISTKRPGRLDLRELEVENLILIALVVYLPYHLIEEGIFGFPTWAELRLGLHNYTLGKWLLHVYLAFFPAAGYLLYSRDNNRYLPLALGILVFGLMKIINHIIFGLIFLECPAGLVTGLAWAFLFALALTKLLDEGRLSLKLALWPILSGRF